MVCAFEDVRIQPDEKVPECLEGDVLNCTEITQKFYRGTAYSGVMYLCRKRENRICTNSCPDFPTCDARKIPLTIRGMRFEFDGVVTEDNTNHFPITSFEMEDYVNAIAGD